MESLRHQLLQAELTRIEQEAEARSIAIMNRIDTLIDATRLCARINDGITCGVRFDPTISYSYDATAEITLHTSRDGDVFMTRLRELGLGWQDADRGFNDQRGIEIDGLRGVTVFVRETFLSAQTLQAAA